MAETFTSKVRAFLVAILIGLLVIAFAVWGVNDVFSGRAGTDVLKVGDSGVSTGEFNRAYRQRLRNMAAEQGVTLTDQQAYDRGVHRSVLSELLARKIIEVDADDLGIGVNATTAKEILSEIDVFKDDITGKFSVSQLDSVLARSNPPLSREDYEALLITDLRQQQTLPAISGGIQAPLQFAEQRYQFITEQRKAKVLTLTDLAVPAAPEPTDEDLKTYIESNAVRFTAPEYRRVTLLRLEPFDFVLMDDNSTRGVQSRENLKTAYNNVFVTEEQIQARFDYQVELGELGTEANRSLVQITSESEEIANQVAEKLQEGLSPTEVTTLLGLIEPITYEEVSEEEIFDPETAKLAFEMQDGEVRSLLGGFGNWVTIQITGAQNAEKPDINTIKDDIIRDILTGEATDRIYEYMGKVQDEIDEGRSIEEAAELVGVPFAQLPFVDRSGATPDGVKMAGIGDFTGIGADDELLKAIFTADQGFETDYFDTSTGGQAMLRVDAIIESTRRPFDEVREQAAGLWKVEYVEKSLNDLMTDLAAKARDGESLEDLAAGIENGASVEEISLVRAAPGNQIGPRLTVDILEADVGDIERGDGPGALSKQIAKLVEINSNQDGLGGQYADFLQDQVSAEIIEDLNLAYRQAVLTQHEMFEDSERVKQLLGVTGGE